MNVEHLVPKVLSISRWQQQSTNDVQSLGFLHRLHINENGSHFVSLGRLQKASMLQKSGQRSLKVPERKKLSSCSVLPVPSMNLAYNSTARKRKIFEGLIPVVANQSMMGGSGAGGNKLITTTSGKGP